MKISVYIPSYNQSALLVEAIDSVLSQTLAPHEIIIIDDVSSDDSVDVIRGYASRHPDLIRPIFHETNTGISGVRNDAIEAATGTHITYVDGDDRLLPDKLEKEAAALREHPDSELAFSNYFNITYDGKSIDTWIQDLVSPQGDIFEPVFSRMLPRRDIFRFELASLDAVRRAGPYDRNLKIYEDFEFKMRLSKTAKARYVNEALAERRCHDAGLSSARVEDHFATLRTIARKNQHLLDDLPGPARRRTRRLLMNWIAESAVMSGRYALNDGTRSMWKRKCSATRCFVFAAAFAPDLLTIGDFYRLILPSRTAERLCEGTSDSPVSSE